MTINWYTNTQRCIQCLVGLISLALTTEAWPATFTVPRSLATTEDPLPGEGSTGFLGTGPETSLYQIAASELAAQGLAVGNSIVGVRARLNGGNFGPPTAPADPITWGDFTIKLSQATNSIAAMSTTFATNMTNTVVVRTGPYTLPAGSMPGGSSPNAFGALVQFETPYLYQGGDLCFYFSHTSAPAPLLAQDGGNSYTGAGTLYRRLLAVPENASTGFLANTMTVVQFEVVPEPASAYLLCIGFVSMRTMRRRPRRA